MMAPTAEAASQMQNQMVADTVASALSALNPDLSICVFQHDQVTVKDESGHEVFNGGRYDFLLLFGPHIIPMLVRERDDALTALDALELSVRFTPCGIGVLKNAAEARKISARVRGHKP